MITRYNYEEYFLLFVDNELSAAEKKAVQEFVQQNPDLERELIMLQQSVVKPESNIIFENKELLLKQAEENSLINLANYEEYFLLYIDDELDRAAKKDVEDFINQYPSLQNELTLLQQAKLEPDAAIVFKGKEVLYKQEEKRRPILFARMSAAAVAILLVTGFLFYNRIKRASANQPNDFALKIKSNGEKGSSIEKNKKDSLTVTQPVVGSFNKTGEIKKQDAIKEIKKEKEIQVQYAINNKRRGADNRSEKGIAEILSSRKQEAQLKGAERDQIVKTNPEEKQITTSLAASKLSVEPDNLIAKTEQPDEPSKTNPENFYAKQVAMIDNNVDIFDTDNTSAKKNKLRGIFRRVSRVFEKTTNADESHKRSVAIGSFQIALK